MTILQISDTHNKHNELPKLPEADVIIHCGDFTQNGTEKEILDFLNWFIGLPYKHKIFIVGNHDICLWEAEGIEDLPENVHFLQDIGCEIEGVKFFGLCYNHSPQLIPDGIDVLITHEPPKEILDWNKILKCAAGSELIREKVFEIKPRYHLFGHEHEAFGIEKHEGIIFSNAAVLDDFYNIREQGNLFSI